LTKWIWIELLLFRTGENGNLKQQTEFLSTLGPLPYTIAELLNPGDYISLTSKLLPKANAKN
jgi:hypothetical protein